MEIYSPARLVGRREYISTLNSPSVKCQQYGRGSRQRLMNLDLPEPVISKIEQSREVPIGIQWSSPRDGVVLERNAIEGMRAQPGQVLFRIADHSQVWALIDVAERDLGTLAIGQTVTVRARSFPGREFIGSINVIYPEIDGDAYGPRAC